MVDQPTPAEMNGHARPSPTDRHLGELFQREVQRLAHAVAPGERETDLGLIDSATFFNTDYCLEWLVNGLLVRDQPGVLGGPKKALKTSLIVDLALSLASGRPFLGQFAVLRPVRVGLISGESGQATLQETARRVAAAKRISNRLPHLPIHWGFRLPRLSVEEDLDQLADVIETHDLDVIILDPLYLSLLAGGTGQQASNLFDIGPLLAAVADTCLTAGATPLLVHHTRKNAAKGNSHAAPPELEDLAFAGIQEFARQWLLVGRRQPYVPNSGEHRL
ncbi:MAG: AAA family ATPase, partial [Pirellulales bacterium]